MYMTIKEMRNQLDLLLREHPELDQNMLVVGSDVVDEEASGDYKVGTVCFGVAEKVVSSPVLGTKILNPWTLYVYPPNPHGKTC